MNPIDETSNLQPFNLDSLEIDLGLGDSDLYGNISFAKLFSRIKNLRLKDLLCKDITLRRGWDIMLMASQSLTTLDSPWDDGWFITVFPGALEGDPFNLSWFPALRHFSIQIRTWSRGNITMLPFLSQLLSISPSTSGIETLEIMITWVGVEIGCGKDLFSSDTGWSVLDEVLSSEIFISLRKVVFGFSLQIQRDGRYHNRINLELEDRSLTLPYVDALFPMFRALTSA